MSKQVIHRKNCYLGSKLFFYFKRKIKIFLLKYYFFLPFKIEMILDSRKKNFPLDLFEPIRKWMKKEIHGLYPQYRLFSEQTVHIMAVTFYKTNTRHRNDDHRQL